MVKLDGNIDLSLFLDQSLLDRQNQLRRQIESLLVEVSNALPQDELLKIHGDSKGCKISKGNGLIGSPYWVLDVIRDFDLQRGINLRLLVWWGKGAYLLVFLGGKIQLETEKLLKENFSLALSHDRWNLHDQIILRNLTNQVSPNLLAARESILWIKELELSSDLEICSTHFQKEIKKVLSILSFDH